MDFFEGEYQQKANWKKEATGIASWISLNLAGLVVTIVTMVAMDGDFVVRVIQLPLGLAGTLLGWWATRLLLPLWL